MDDGDSFEERLRAMAREISKTVEQAAEHIDLDEIADKIGVNSERVREFAEFAGSWLAGQFGDSDHDPDASAWSDPETSAGWKGQSAGSVSDTPQNWSQSVPPVDRPGDRPAADAPEARSPRRAGPHPLDTPTEDQGLALSALDSGRWRVEPGSNELISHGEGPDPRDAASLVGELRARDWIAATGEVTLVGHDALRRWLGRGA